MKTKAIYRNLVGQARWDCKTLELVSESGGLYFLYYFTNRKDVDLDDANRSMLGFAQAITPNGKHANTDYIQSIEDIARHTQKIKDRLWMTPSEREICLAFLSEIENYWSELLRRYRKDLIPMYIAPYIKRTRSNPNKHGRNINHRPNQQPKKGRMINDAHFTLRYSICRESNQR